MSPTYVLGINAFHGDASAVLLRDGVLVAAVEEERFRRVKHWAGFPSLAIAKCLELGGIEGSAISHVAVSRKPGAHLARKLWFAATNRPDLSMIRDRVQNAGRVQSLDRPLAEVLAVPASQLPRVHYVEHHPSHLASAFFVSPFDDAAVCAIDGFGDFVSTSSALGEGTRLRVLDRVYFPHSLGLMYTAVTQYLGFPSYGDEFKVMGLAPYGSPTRVEELRRLVKLKSGGGFELDLRYFVHWNGGMKMEWEGGYPTLSAVYSPELTRLLGPPRDPKAPLLAEHEDLARSLQAVYEECAMHVLNGLWERTRNPRLCLAGGCAMNSVANGKVRDETPFTDVYIQPAAADNGTALGAAFDVWHQKLGNARGFEMRHGYWGTRYPETDVHALLRETGADQTGLTVQTFDTDDALCQEAARLIADGNVIGWFQGAMEWGSRALGNRSILADPRRSDIRDLINAKIKFREKFRPFAPSIAEEALDDFFVGAVPDPFMQQVYPVRPDKRSILPAITHADGSGRLQTVSTETNPLYYRLIRAFAEITGVPVLLNTSFNENEPIVDTPRQALDCVLRTRMDAVAIGRSIIRRQS